MKIDALPFFSWAWNEKSFGRKERGWLAVMNTQAKTRRSLTWFHLVFWHGQVMILAPVRT